MCQTAGRNRRIITGTGFVGINGLVGFVWYGSISHEEKILVSATVHQVEPGFVAIKESEPAVVCQGGECAGEAREVAAGRLSLSGFGEEGSFDGPQAALPPVGGGHFLDQIAFGVVSGAELGDV